MGYAETDSEAQARLITFRRGLATLGWNEGSNLQIDARWSGGVFLSPGPNLLSNVSDVFSGERLRVHRSSPTWGSYTMAEGPHSFEHYHPLC